MLGTGIASADEDVNPDKPASPLDGSLTVPVHLDNNVLATPMGQKVLPGMHKDVAVRPSDVTGALPVAPIADQAADKATETAAPVVTKAQSAVAPLPQEGRDFAAPLADEAQPVTDKLKSLPEGDKLPPVPSLDKVNVPAVDRAGGSPAQGNQINVDLVVPVDVSGNAIAILGKAETTNDSDHSYGTDRDVATEGADGFVGGNVVDLDWALPVQVTDNAVAALGKASAAGTNSQEAWATGDIVTGGSSSVLGGNVVAPQFATPVQVGGNAVAGGGWAQAYSEAQTSGEAGGSILTGGTDSAGGGNAVPVPVAVPARVNGNAVAGLGDAAAWTESTADATAGATRTGKYGVPTYVETNADNEPALAAGNVVQPALSGPAMLCGNAGVVAGSSEGVCDTATTTAAGGTSRSTGAGSTLSGAIADAPVVLPVQGFGNAVAGLGEAAAGSDNAVSSTAGGDSYTRGHDSIASGSVVKAPVTGTGDVFANSVAVLGYAGSLAENDVVVHSGGNAGTTGDDSQVGGNMVATPVVAPAEVYGNAVAGAGGAEATAEETKTTESGSGRNTDDDFGVLASNLVTVPVATAAQVFGNGAGALAWTDAEATAVEEFSAGGNNRATGIAGLGSGNIGQVPVAMPFQVFGSGATALGRGTQAAANETEMEAGGSSFSDGTRGTGAGNVVTAPIAGAGQVFGDSVAVLGRNRSLAGSQTETEAGGDTVTSGYDGLAAGNVVAPQVLPIVQGFAVAASGLAGVSSAAATNITEAESGGDIVTTGDEGYLSGNLADVPAAAVVQAFGDAVAAVASKAHAQGLSSTQGEVGGTSATRGEKSKLSGIDGTLPVGVGALVYDVPLEVLGRAIAESANRTVVQVGEGESQLHLPVAGALTATELPALPARQRSLPADGDFRGAFTGVLSGVGLPGQDQVTGVTDLAQNGDLPETPQILPAPLSRTDVPGAVPGAGLVGGLPVDVAVPGVLPGQRDLPGAGLVGGLPVDVTVPGGLPAQRDLPGADLVGGLPVDVAVPGALPAQRDLPGADLVGDLPVDVTVPGGLPAQRDLPGAGLIGDLPVDVALPGVLPGQRDLPGAGLVGGLPVDVAVPGALPGQRDLPGAGLIGGLPVDVALPGVLPGQRDLPGAGLIGDLPVDVTVPGGLPAQRDLPQTPGLPEVPGLTQIPGLPQTPGLPRIPGVPLNGDVLSPLSGISVGGVNAFGGARSGMPADLTDVTTRIPVVPAAGDLNEITAVIPAIPAERDLTDITMVIPASPSAGDLTDATTVLPVMEFVTSAPVVQSPSVGRPVNGVQTPELGSSLDSTRAALANLFTTHPID